MAMTALDALAPASAMLEALRQRRISSTELVELHLRRIAQHNPTLNATVVPAPDRQAAAREQGLQSASLRWRAARWVVLSHHPATTPRSS